MKKNSGLYLLLMHDVQCSQLIKCMKKKQKLLMDKGREPIINCILQILIQHTRRILPVLAGEN